MIEQDACQEVKAAKERMNRQRDEFNEWFRNEMLPKAITLGWFGVRERNAQAAWCWEAWKKARGF